MKYDQILTCFNFFSLNESHYKSKEWEGNIGSKFYFLIWLDTLSTIFITLLDALFQKLVFKKYSFIVPSHILEIVYRQAIIWIGTIYSPVIPLIAVVTGMLIFYVKKWILLSFGSPPSRLYSSSAQVFYFVLFLSVTLVISAVPILYAITNLKPTIGPHFGLEYMYDALPRWVNSLNFGPRSFIGFLSTVTFLMPFLSILILWVYYLLAVAAKRRIQTRELTEELESVSHTSLSIFAPSFNFFFSLPPFALSISLFSYLY